MSRRNKTISYQAVCKLVEDRYTVSEAIDRLNGSKSRFYNRITTQQKLELGQIRGATTGRNQTLIFKS